MRVDDFDYNLPESLIAQRPWEKRDESRLLIVHRKTGTVEHKHFYDIIDYLEPGDCLVLNNSKVLPARLFGYKETTGAKVEFLLIKRLEGDLWQTMVRPGRRIKPGDTVTFGPGFSATVKDFGDQGTRLVEFHYDGIFMEKLEQYGAMPLPPYIERKATDSDNERYQTVYCEPEGSVAAPTAGLHFTHELLRKIQEKGVKIAYVTLHVGIGTFRPVKATRVEDHEMHFEEYDIPVETASVINETKRNGGRIISVGTTSCRTVESAASRDADGSWSVREGSGSTGIFIYPGYEFRVIDGLITNFHLPKSTLLMLISAFYDREKMLDVYEEAIRQQYRFFSYGDAMYIE
jgi:S-adenosylmethionine:tRNA ribosyltransferase-isomerase